MKKNIAIILPYKEIYSKNHAGAASIWLKDYNDKSSLNYNLDLNGFDIKISSNYNFMGEIPDYGANLEISNKF